MNHPSYQKEHIRVLLLEDDEADALMLSEDLEEDPRDQYNITHTTTLGDTLKELSTQEYDIVLSDLTVPDSHGTETFYSLLENTTLPIIVLTGDENDELSTLAIEEGVQDFIVKNNLERYDVPNAIKYAIQRHKINQQIQQSNQLKSEFLANMSHEIRTPLNGLIGAADLLRKSDLTDSQEKYLRVITNSGDTLLALINDILDISKIEAGELEINNEPIVLRSFFKDTLQAIAPRANEKGIELAIDYKGNVPISISADIVRLNQIMTNLLGNSLKFVETGHIAVTVAEKKTKDGIVTLHISVEDTGIGIPAEKTESIFDKFAQADASTTKKYGGTGLGLAITQKLVEIMGGSIGVESTVGVGTTFFFEIDVPIITVPDKQKVSEIIRQIRYSRVLAIDDSLVTLQFLSRALESMNINHDISSDPEKSLEILAQAADTKEGFDIVIIDYEMPNIDGIELAKAIRENPKTKHLKLILISALGKISHHSGIDPDHYFNGYLLKPVSAHDLRQKLFEVAISDASSSSSSEGYNFEETSDKLNAHILLVENELVNQMVATDMLEGMGCTVDLAENGQEAVDMLFKASQPYNIVLMDCMMPIMDGFEATKEIRRIERADRHSHQIIIAMTANAMSGEKEKCLSVGMDDYLAKPVKEQVLFEKLQEHLSRGILV